MNNHRKSLFGLVVFGVLTFVITRVLSPIGDVEVQSYWTATAKPYLAAHASGWVAIVIDWFGPFWSGVTSAITVLLLFEAVFWATGKRNLEPATVKANAARTLLRLRFTGQMEAPHAIEEENILSWFAYWSPGAVMQDPLGNVVLKVPSSWALFIDFKDPVDYRQLIASFNGGRPTSSQVRLALATSAVITMEGDMPACEMEAVTRG